MNLDQNNSIPTNLDNDDSHIAPVTTSGSTSMEAFGIADPISPSGVELYSPEVVYGSGYGGLRYGNVPGAGFRDSVQNVRPLVSGATFVTAPVAESPPVMATVRYSSGLNFGNRVGGNNWDSWMRVKLWCLYGGMVMPRPPDGAFRYVGGDSKIVYVSRHVSLNELVQKIADSCGQFDVLKYQLPEEDNLDALVSVVSTDDLENMMCEYDRMVMKSFDGRARLKVYLFSAFRRVSSPAIQTRGFQSNGQGYIEEVAEIVDESGSSITRTESMANATFKQDSDLSGTEAIDSTGHDKVEEVKGIVDGNGGSITRKESMASATSMQDSDFREAEATVSTGHEQVDFEEVKGIVDGDGGGITRKESMATATSLHDSYLSRAKAIDSTSHEQEDIEEVKRIVDGNGGSITRSESMASASSMRDSDFNGIENIDRTGHGHGDITGITSSGDVSSENNFTTSQEYVHRLACMDPNPPMHVEPASDPLGIPAVGSHPPVLSTQPVTVVQPQQQQQAGIRPCAPYFQAYVDSQQEVLSRAQHVQYPSQLLATVFTQHQKCDNVASVTPSQFIPVLQMPMTPNSYDNTKPTAVEPVTQPQQVLLEHSQEENMYGQRLAQISGDQSYNACHAPDSQPHTILGGHGWHQAPQIERVLSSDGFQQQVALTENMPGIEEGSMRQKALLHTHSDTLAQGQRENPTTTSNFSPIYQSLQQGDKIRGQPISTAALTATLAEGIIENQVTEAPPTSLSHHDHKGRNPESDEVAISQYVDDRTSLQRKKDYNHLKASVPQCVEGGPQSYNSAFMGNTPQLYQENVFQKPVVPMQHKAKEEVSNSTAVSVASVGDAYFQVSDHLCYDSSKEHSGKLPSSVSKEGTLAPYLPYDQLKHIDSRMQNLVVQCPSEVSPDNEQLMSRAGNSKKGDIMDNKAYQIYNREPHIDNVGFMGSAPQLYQENVSQKLVVPMQHKAKEEVFCDMAISVASVDDTYSQVPDHLVHDSSREQSGKLSGFVSKEGMLEPSIAYDQPKEIDSRMKNSGVLPSEVLDNEQIMLLSGNSKQKDIMDNIAYQIDNKGPCYKQNEVSYCPSNKVPCSHGEGPYPYEMIKPPLLGIDPAQVAKISPPVAEGVAASVPQTCIPFGPASQDIKVQNYDEVLHAEDMKLMLPERANLGFHVSNGLGRLQIIKNSDLEELQELGSSTIGTVYYGKWRGSDVAIKRINDRCFDVKPSELERMRVDFGNEAIKLADLHHPNVVAFYGVALDGPGGSVATVTEYMVNGSLRTVLQKNEKNLDMQKRLLIAKDVAYGMEYLHGKNIVHFDLKSDNLLVNLLDPDRPVCKVADIGLSKFKRQTLISGGVRGTLPWMAPELLDERSSVVSEKVDVFSFGIVLWELLTGEKPYRDLHFGALIGGIVNNTLRPPVPDACDSDWRSLMERCWSAEPSERPNFTEVANQLETMVAKVFQKVQAEQQPFSNRPQV